MLLNVWAKMRRVVRSQRTRRSVSRAIESLETRFLLTTWTGDIPNGTVWASGQVQQIGGNVHIPVGSTLTIQPGAVVKFDNVYNFTVDGTLLAQGTGVAPIVFTDIHDDVGGDTNGDGSNSGPGNGDWGSLSFQSDSTGSILDHVDVRFGGRNAASELLVNGGQLTFSNGIIRNSITAGVRIQNSTPTLTNISYQNNNSAAVSMDLASNPTVSGVTVSQNGVNGLVLDAGTIAGNSVWDDPDIVYWFSGNITVPQGKTLAIGAGQVIKRNIGQDLLVNGTLTAAGTQAAPIIFADFDDDTAGGDTNNNGTNSGPFNGGTGEIVFSNTSTANVLDHVDVRNARNVAAAAVVDDGAPLTFTNSMIRYTDSVGLRIQNSNPTLTNMTYQGNQRAAASMDLMSNPAISGVTMLGNGVNGLLLDGGTLAGNAFWNDADIVYWFTNDITVPQGKSLTIGSGQIIKRDIGQDLFINGTLNAMGTQAAPIIFADRDDDTAGGDTNNNGTNSGAGNGGTGAIVFSNTSTANVLDHVDARNARNVGTAAVVVNGAPLTFTNSIISQTDTVGLRIQSSNPILTNMTYHDNHGAAISMDLVSQPVISGVSLSNNWVNALSLDTGSLVGNSVWNNPEIVYWFTGNVTVPQGLSLTIGAGQIIKRDVAQNLFINGSLIAGGTQAASIIFADRNDDTAGGDTNDDGSNTFSLNGGTGEIVFSNTSTANVLDHTEVRNARFIDTAAVVVNGAPLTFTNSLIGQSDGIGLRIQSSNPVLTNMTYQNNNGAAVSMDLLSNPAISGVTMLNNHINALTVDGGTLSNNSVWNDPDIVYWLSGSITVSQGNTLAIAAGQIIKRNNAQDLIVNGTLNATGTETAPIIFADENDDTAGGDTNNDGTNSGPLNGGTGEIEFLSPSTANILDHVEVRNARFVATAAVVVDHAPLTFTNSLIVQSDGPGLRIQSSNPVLTNMTYQNNNGAAVSTDLAAAPIISGVTLLNNRVNGLTLDGGTLSSNASWNNPDIVYVLSGGTGTITIPQGITLNVGAGQVIKVSGRIDAFDVNGTLNTQGTAAAPVVITSYSDDTAGGDTNNDGSNSGPSPANWDGISFTATSVGSHLDHVHVRYGADTADTKYGTINVTGSSVTMSNSIISQSGHVGVDVFAGATFTLTDSLIVNCGGFGLQAEASSTLIAINDTIDGNLRGITLDSPTAILKNDLITNNSQVGISQTGVTNLTLSFSDVFSNGTDYSGLASQTNLNGNVSVDPRYFNRQGGQYQLRAGSPVEDAGTSSGATATDFFGNPRFKDPNLVGRGDGSGYDMGPIEVQQIATSNVDLSVGGITGPTTGVQNQSVTVNWTVHSTGAGAATGTWHDSVYLSPSPSFTADAILLGTVQHSGDLATGQSYNATGTFTLPGVTPGNYYLLVRVNSQNEVFEGSQFANNVAASSQTIATTLPALTLGAATTGTLPGTGKGVLYQVTTAAGTDLNLGLAGAAGTTNELYVSFGTVPTRQSFDSRSVRVGAANQSLLVSNTRAGTYYILVYGANVPSSEQFQLTASTAGFTVGSVSPVQGSNTGKVTLTIDGTDFDSHSHPQLVTSGGITLQPSAVYFSDSGSISATFDLAGTTVGTANVQIVNTGNVTQTLTHGFNIIAGTAGTLTTSISTPSGVRVGRAYPIVISYANTGNTDLLAPILNVTGTNSDPLSFDTDFTNATNSLNLIGANPNGPAGILPPGAHGTITIYASGLTVGANHFQLTIGGYPGTPIDWAGIEPLIHPAWIPDDEWHNFVTLLQANIGDTWDDFAQVISADTTLLPAGLGRNTSLADVFQLEISKVKGQLQPPLSGHVYLGDTSHPLGNVAIDIGNPDTGTTFSTTSLTDGSFLIPFADVETYDVQIAGFVSTTPQLVVGDNGLNNVDLVVTQAGAISGRVVNSAGAPLPGLLVTAMGDDGNSHLAETAADGTYVIDSLPAGVYEIDAGGNALATSTVSNITVIAGGRTGNINLLLQDAATISGTVLGPNGPITGATVSAATDDGSGSSAVTDDAGHYTVTGLSTGVYILTASAPDLASSEISSINLAAGTTLNGQNFSLAVGGNVAGQILMTGTTTPVSGVVLTLTGSAGTFTGVTDTNGEFSVTNLPVGSYVLVALASAFMSVETQVTVTANHTSTANLQTTTLGVVSGLVTDSVTHSPLTLVIVQVFNDTGFVGSALTDAQGNYEIDGLDAGNYQIVLGDYGSPGVAKANITLSVAQSHATTNLTVGLAGSVSGFVFQADGVTPDAGITVALSSHGIPVLFTTTDTTGKYVFDVLAGGTFDIIASDVGIAFPSRTGVAINGGSKLTGLNFQAGNQVLGGKIVDKNNNQPLAGATVELSYADPVAGLTSIDSVQTGSDGSYSLSGAIPGNWQITVTASGHATTTQSVVVPASGPQTANFQLNLESVLSGTIRNAITGSPLANVTLELLSATGAQLLAIGTSDELGHYQIHGLVPGVYRLLTQGSGLQSVLVGNVTVGSASSVLNVGLATSTTTVTGTVTSGIGALGNATVTILDPQGIIWGSTQTADAGTYTITGLPEGQYTVIATAVGYQSAAPATLSLLNGQSNAQLNLSATPIAITDAPPLPGDGSTTSNVPLWVVAFSDPDPRTLMKINEDLAKSYVCPNPTSKTPSARNVLTLVAQASNDQLANLQARWPKFAKFKIDFAQTNQKLVAATQIELKDAQLAFATYKTATKNGALESNLVGLIQHLGQLQDLLAKIGSGVDDTFQTQLDTLGAAVTSEVSNLNLQIADLIKGNSQVYADQVLVRNLQNVVGDKDNVTVNVNRMSGDIAGLERYEKLKEIYDQSLAGLMKAYDELVRSCNCAAANAPGLPYKSPTSLPTDPSNPLYNLFYGKPQVTPHLETPSVTPNESLSGTVCIMQPVDPIGKPDPTGVKKGPDNPPDNTDGGGSDADVEDAFDPNNFTGPSGFGTQGFIQPQVLSYQVDFENDPAKATAAAQIVSTTFTIDPDLDPSTLQFTGFGFGQQNITLPPGLFHYQTTLDLRPQGIDLLVPVTLDENRVTGVVTVKFESLDPITNLPPDGVNDGFLPVDDVAGDGQGYFTYSVQPKAGLATGTQITEQTSIVFDSNASVQTPVALNTIDAGTPSSSVSPLASQSNANFTVNWSGTDDIGGSGIASYDIYVSDNGGDYSQWQSATSATSATYMGQAGHTYRFYSVARDNVGHVELAPLTADATTTTVLVDSPPVIVNQSFNVAENSAANTAVGTVVASDPDVPTVLTYSITAGNSANTFTIDPTSGVIKLATGATVNFESTSTYTLTVQVTDDASPSKSSSAQITIHVTDVNEAPTIPAGQSFAVSGSAAAGFGIGTVTATDPDATAPNNSRNFSILNATGAFTINAQTGQITVANAATLTALAGTTVTLQVTDTDGGTPALSATQNVSVIVGPANAAPVLANPGPVSTFIGNVKTPVKVAPTLTVTDADGPTSIASIVISVNLGAAKKNPDNIDLPGLGPIGTFMTAIVGGRMQFTITVNPGVTNAAIQTLLDNITFQTKGTGLKLTSRSFQIQVTDTTGLHSNTVTQNLVVEKKAPKPPKHPK